MLHNLKDMTPLVKCDSISTSNGVITKYHYSASEGELLKKKYGYARVSTANQDLETQIQALEAAGCDKIYSEHFTGTKTDRPQFNLLIEQLQLRDTLVVVTKLDRFARSATKGSELVKELIDCGIAVHILNIGLLDNTPASKLVRNIFFCIC